MPKPTTYVLLLVLSASAAFAQQASKPFRYSLPDKKGAFDIALPGIRIQQVSYKPDGSGFRLLGDGDAGLSVSVFLEILKNGSTSSTVRDSEWPKARFERLKKEFKARDFRPYEKGDIAFMEYIAPEYRGIAVAQKSVHAYYSGGQIWAEVHISKINYTSADETRFAKLLETARVVPDFTPGSVSYFGYGTVFYREQKYAKAAEYLQRSLDLDVQDHGLGPTSWKVAVDNLGISYGISGDLKRARGLFESALLKDSTYPLFYYNLSCAFAEMGDLENAMTNLQKAFQYKANVLPGEKMPDPRSDDSFKRYRKDERFTKLVDSLHLN